MKYAKLTNQTLTYAPHPLIINGQEVFTNDEAIFNSQGYKRVVYVTAPQREGFYPVYTWVETETEITQTYTYEAIEPSQEEKLEAQVIFTAIMTDTLIEEEADE